MRKKGLPLIAAGAVMLAPSCGSFCDSFSYLKNPPSEIREIIRIESLLISASTDDFKDERFREDFSRLERRYSSLLDSENIRELRKRYENSGKDCLLYGTLSFLGAASLGLGIKRFRKLND